MDLGERLQISPKLLNIGVPTCIPCSVLPGRIHNHRNGVEDGPAVLAAVALVLERANPDADFEGKEHSEQTLHGLEQGGRVSD